MRACVSSLVMAILVVVAPVRAEVVEQSDGHFAVSNTVTVSVESGRAFRAITAEVGQWWDPVHTFFGSAEALLFEPRVGGCFCERLQDGRGVEHLRVVYTEPGRMIRLTGAIGPLQGLAITGVATWTLSETPSGTTIEMCYSVAGHRTGGLGELAAPVDAVLAEQLARLKAYLDSVPR